MGIYRRFKIKLMQWLIPMADPGFPRGGGQLPGGGALQYDFAKFPKNCMKLKEFGPPRDASLTPPLDPSLDPVFPRGGGGTGGANLLFGLIFPQKIHENEISPRGGCEGRAPLDPPV